MTSEYTRDGVWLLQTQNVREFFLKDVTKVYIHQDFHEQLAKSKVRKGDILVARSGSFGAASIYLGDDEINSADIVIIQALTEKIDPYYLVTFLNCNYGVNQLLRFASGGLQRHVNLTILENLKVPALGKGAQNLLNDMITRSYTYKEEAERLYMEAQTLVLAKLGLTDWRTEHQHSFVTNFSDARRAGRVDADYFQPKYDEIIASIKSYPCGWKTLGDLAHLKDKNFMPVGATECKYIELANIAANGEIAYCMVAPAEELPARARQKVSTGDVIISSIEGSLDSIALIDSEYDQAICSTGFHVINSTSLNSETLLVLLKSPVGQLQLKKGCSGTVLTAINRGALKQVVLPLIPETAQTQIQQLVAESFAFRHQSKHLLECAKRAVEIAIEQDEQTAIAWIDSATPRAPETETIQRKGTE